MSDAPLPPGPHWPDDVEVASKAMCRQVHAGDCQCDRGGRCLAAMYRATAKAAVDALLERHRLIRLPNRGVRA